MKATENQTKTIGRSLSRAGNEGNGRTASSSIGTLENKYPAHCMLCLNRERIFHAEGHPDDGMPYVCALMLEKMETGVLTWHCNYRESAINEVVDAIRRNQEIHGLIDAETAQAVQRAREIGVELRDTIFKDPVPFDAKKAITDLVGS